LIQTSLENLTDKQCEDKENERDKLKENIDALNEINLNVLLEKKLNYSITPLEAKNLIAKLDNERKNLVKKTRIIKVDEITKHKAEYNVRKGKVERDKSSYEAKFLILIVKFNTSQIMTSMAANNAKTRATLADIRVDVKFAKNILELQ